MIKLVLEQGVDIDVKHEGILEVPEDKNVDDLPLSHFIDLANRKGLSKITKALNNLQVWNKNKDPKLSKWAGNMIDKLNKKFEERFFMIRKLHLNEGYTMPYTLWVLDGDDNTWKMYDGRYEYKSNTGDDYEEFLGMLNVREFPNWTQYNNYIDWIVLPAGEIPDGKVKESLFMKENNISEEYTYIRSKEVPDFDGWNTEYTMYYDEIMERYVFVLGDSDLYDPNDGYEDFDWECETEREANEWFDSYEGFVNDLDESYKG